MVPIALTSDGQFDEEGFRNHLLALCRQHKQEKRALAFAFIVCDFDDQAVNQILQHKFYWVALDKISGKFLSVFYINTQNNYYKRRQREIYEAEKRQREINSKKGYISFFVPLTLKPTPLDNAIGFIKKEFELEEDIKHPFVLFFQTDGEDISDFFIVTLKQEKLEEAFLELRDHIKNAVDSLSKVKPEYADNHQEIFNLIKSEVGSEQFYNFMKKKVASKFDIGTIISLIKLIAGGH